MPTTLNKLTKFFTFFILLFTFTTTTVATTQTTTANAAKTRHSRAVDYKKTIKKTNPVTKRYKLKKTKSVSKYRAHSTELASQSPYSNPDTDNTNNYNPNTVVDTWSAKLWTGKNSDLTETAPWETNSTTNQDLTTQTFGDNHTVYYRVNMNAVNYMPQIQTAVSRWNALGVINFQQTDDPNQTAIDISYGDDPNTDEQANAAAETNYNYVNSTMKDQHIYLESKAFQNNSNNTNTNVIEHEFGHALGFAHDTTVVPNTYAPNSSDNNMYPLMTDGHIPNDGDHQIIPIGDHEANALRAHYNNTTNNN